MAKLRFKNVFKIYKPDNVMAANDFNLEIEDKEFIVLVGPSGCGKSTTIRMVAGLEEITKGELYIDDILEFLFGTIRIHLFDKETEKAIC